MSMKSLLLMALPTLAYGVSINMDATPNHYAIGDNWSFSAIPTNVPVSVYRDSNGSLVDIVRTVILCKN